MAVLSGTPALRPNRHPVTASAFDRSEVAVIDELRARLRRTRQAIVCSIDELRASRENLTDSASRFRTDLAAMRASLRSMRTELLAAVPPRGPDVPSVDGGRSARPSRAPGLEPRAALTPRECEVMDLVLVGRTSREIAATLGLSVRTVDGHRGRIFQKTGVTSAARLLATVLGNHP